MSTFSKRGRIIASVIISIVIWVSLNLILIQFQKKELDSTFILKAGQVNSSIESKQNSPKEAEKVEIEGAVLNQYKENNWKIIISKINLEAPILEGTSQEVLRRGVGHFTSTSKWNGNVVLAAHNRGYKYNFFQEIKRLEVGDIIKYQTEQGIRTYSVIGKRNIKETDFSCLKDTKENQLTLITCLENMPEYRLCVQAKEIKQ